MWMCYVQEIEITDMKSGVEYLLQKFRNLDAEHEAIYGLGIAYNEEECKKLSDNYGKGATICELYLDGSICEGCLVHELTELKLKDFLYRIERHLSSEHRLKLITLEEQDEETESDEDALEDSKSK